jgi:hypothetical protein
MDVAELTEQPIIERCNKAVIHDTVFVVLPEKLVYFPRKGRFLIR